MGEAVGAQVPDADVVAGGRNQGPSVAGEAADGGAGVAPRDPEDILFMAVQRGQHDRTGLHGVSDPPGRNAQPGSGHRIDGVHAVSHRRDPACLGLPVAPVTGAGLLPGREARDKSEREESGEGGQQGAAAAEFPGAGGTARAQERLFHRSQGLIRKVLLRRCQASAPVEGPRITGQVLPGVGCLGQAAMGAQTLTGLLDPGVQAGPGRDEGLVGQVDRIVVEREEVGLRQAVEDRSHFVGGSEVQLRTAHRAAGVRGALSRV